MQTSSGEEDENYADGETMVLPLHTQLQYSGDEDGAGAGFMPFTQVQHAISSDDEVKEDGEEAEQETLTQDVVIPFTQVQQTASSGDEEQDESASAPTSAPSPFDEGGFGDYGFGNDDHIVNDYAEWEDDAQPSLGIESDIPSKSKSPLQDASEENDRDDDIQNDYADWEMQDEEHVNTDAENKPPSSPQTIASPCGSKKKRDHQQRTLAFTVQRKPTPSPTLHPHQREAVEWMLAREGRGRDADTEQKQTSAPPVLGGGILADECGLGKTLTALTLTDRARASRHPHRGGTLVVCPAALVGQWVSEIERQTVLRVLAYHSPKQRIKVHSDPFNFCRYDIVVTSYRCVGRDVVCTHVSSDLRARILKHGAAHAGGWVKRSKKQKEPAKQKKVAGCSLLHCVEWERVIADEAHIMSNCATKRFKACNALSARYRWAMTATPVGNSSKELGSLLQWVSQSMASGCRAACISAVEAAMNLGASSSCRVENVIVRRRKATMRNPAAGGGSVDSAHRQQLPELIERDAWLTRREGSFEEALYAALHKHTKKFVRRNVHARDRLHVFELLTRLRQAACHPGLVLRSAATGSDKFRASIAKCVAEFDGVELPRRGLGSAEFLPAVRGRAGTKIRALIKLAKPWAARGEAFVVFSSWTSLLDICGEALERERFACVGSGSAKKRRLRVERIDGTTPIAYRPAVVARCADGRSDCLLVSIKAAGAGLNMPCFRHVVLMEPSWNPSVERQAIGRVHRLGRRDPTEAVTVHRLLVKGTIEESLVEIQMRKRRDARALLENVDEEDALSEDDDEENGMGNALVAALFES